jgi:hypothetical protein
VDKDRLTEHNEHALEIVVVDDMNNISIYKSGFFY